MAFAAADADTESTSAITFEAANNTKIKVTVAGAAANDTITIHELDSNDKSVAVVFTGVTVDGSTVLVNPTVFTKDKKYGAIINQSKTPTDAFTNPSAAYNVTETQLIAVNEIARSASGIYATTTSADANTEDVLEYEVDLIGTDGQPAIKLPNSLSGAKVVVWAERSDKTISDIDKVTTLKTGAASADESNTGYVVVTNIPANGVIKVNVSAAQAGKVTIKAALTTATLTTSADVAAFVKDGNDVLNANGTVTGEFTAQSTSANTITFNVDKTAAAENHATPENPRANSIDKYTVTATVKTKDGQAVKDQKVTISVNKLRMQF